MVARKAPAESPAAPPAPRYFNRELSWIEFNRRVLHEAWQPHLPPLERLRFIGIVSSNLDEFFMVRVATLKRQVQSGKAGNSPCGLSPSEQLTRIGAAVKELVRGQHECLLQQVLPLLTRAGIRVLFRHEYTREHLALTEAMFERDVLPVLTPLRIDPQGVLPFTGNLRLYVAFHLQRAAARGGEPEERKLALVEVPPGLKRFHALPTQQPGEVCYTALEDLIVTHAKLLFPGFQMAEYAIFRITRDADLGVDEAVDEDYLAAMAEILQQRQRSGAVRLQLQTASQELEATLSRLFGMAPSEVFQVPGPLDLSAFNEIVNLDGFDHLRHKPWTPCWPLDLDDSSDLFAVMRQGDLLLHHPYEAFDVVAQLLIQAAADRDVLAIKMTLYRTGGHSRIVQALIDAANRGKQVTVLVELKARFDEGRNIGWAQQLERAGAIVLYGIAELKVHAKAVMIVRRERDGIRRYIHLGTGNYNERTAALYTDLGLLTAREDLARDTALFFNTITGYSAVQHLDRLVMAPIGLKDRTLKLIEREALRSKPHHPGLILAKMNSLADPDVIAALYRASQAGVRIRLNVRGLCMLVPGVPGLSDHIEVVSIVGRFLEHSRVYYFQNGGDEEYYLASADWMPRNLERRAELMFPVDDAALRTRLRAILNTFFEDNQQAHRLLPDGTYQHLRPTGKGEVSAQERFCQEARRQAEKVRHSPNRAFTVRRKPPKGA
jgi:polyphosphate kinase